MSTTISSSPLRPYRLVSVNKFPERARHLVGRVCTEVKDQYEIIHCGNAERVEDVAALVKEVKPDLVFCASMWTPEESQEIKAIARSIVPNVRTYAVPKGLQAEQGSDAVVEHVKSRIPDIVNGDLGRQ